MTTYTPSADDIVHVVEVDFTARPNVTPVHITQIDDKLPILEVRVFREHQPWALPTGVKANIRLGKRDNTFVYNPALGYNSARTSLFFEVTPQMVVIPGHPKPIIEIIINNKKAGSSQIPFDIDPDSIRPGSIESSNEGKSLEEYVKAAETSAKNAKASETAAGDSATKAATSEKNAKNSETAAGTSATKAAESEKNAKNSETAAGNSATKAATSEKNAKSSETNAHNSEVAANDVKEQVLAALASILNADVTVLTENLIKNHGVLGGLLDSSGDNILDSSGNNIEGSEVVFATVGELSDHLKEFNLLAIRVTWLESYVKQLLGENLDVRIGALETHALLDSSYV